MLMVMVTACQGDFDVRWLRGSASDLIFAPWLSAIERDGGRVLGGKRVSTIRFQGGAAATPDEVGPRATGATQSKGGGAKGEGGAQDWSAGSDAGGGGDADADASPVGAGVRVETTDGEVFEPDAVVLAVGITAAKVQSLRT